VFSVYMVAIWCRLDLFLQMISHSYACLLIELFYVIHPIVLLIVCNISSLLDKKKSSMAFNCESLGKYEMCRRGG
jgi:hypothetical protein